MARLIEKKFDPARLTYARKYFTASGRKFVPGDAFDWKKMAIAQRRVVQMFDAGKLTHKDKQPTQEAPKSAEVTVEDNPLDSLSYYDVPVESDDLDDLDAIDDMRELRRIADEIGAPYKVSKADQRQAIRNHRKQEND